MSRQLINRNPDLKRLLDEGYEVEIRSGYLLVKSVPYVNAKNQVALGTLVSELFLQGDTTVCPQNHVCFFAGDYPCNSDGSEIATIRHQSKRKKFDLDLVVDHAFSSKPKNGQYQDHYEKMTTYAAILWSRAQAIDPAVSPKTFTVVETTSEESVFNYVDTASSRAGIKAISRKLEINKLGVVGLGGTGSYVLDLVAKTPTKEIHIFDGDQFGNHNAFRSPGAPSIDELRAIPQKVEYFANLYSRMRRAIVPHDYYINASNVDELRDMEFVFLCLDRGEAKKLIVERLLEFGTPFIDVGMGVMLLDDALHGLLRVTTSSVQKRDHVNSRIPFAVTGGNNEYATNIQIADLNALNATLAVIKWKKLYGFYHDLENEHHSTYMIDGNTLINEELHDAGD